jgi:HEAT repeat protein
LLHEDHDALVRSRAAIALGGLNDPRAVADLELALLDENSTVRSQAINALGRIGDEAATLALGNILLSGTSKTVDRVMAAQALWKHDSESARAYLRAGTSDLDEQVRRASNKAPLPVANSLSDGRTGQEESE